MTRKFAMVSVGILIGLLALGGGWYFRSVQPGAEAEVPLAADFTLPDLDDKPQALSQWRGDIVIVNFWATWCPPCLKEMPEFVKIQQEFGGRGVRFVGVAIEDKAPVLEYLQRRPVNYPILIGGDNGIALAHQLGNVINTVPFTVIIDRQGRIVHRQLGELTRTQALEVLEGMLSKK
ncbi:TlpA family protein disulfide reductase [Methylomonas sp. CM2]|uniref:TlpA family protein disulfide reductase n=1 Tax=Methylomonas sp. CM2 TaxID=3417647 RepID=UPI003CEE0D48